MKDNIRLLIVDDSKVMRDAIADMFSYGSNIQVVGEAANGAEAIEAIALHQPDVITLDVAMPVMDGITALKHIMIKKPTPTVMLSSLTLEGARVAFDALRYGAVDFIAKPSALQDTDLSEQEADIRSKIEYAAEVEVEAIKYIRSSHHNLVQDYSFANGKPEKVVAIGTAEGGYGALLKIIPHLTSDMPYSYLVTMYAIREHVDAFASYLNNISSIHVKRAAHDEVLRPGVVYLNSGLDYTTVHKQGDDYTLHVSPAPFASRKGAIDMLMFSAADIVKENCIGIVLSGSGFDGAEGLEEVARMGGIAIAQDQTTSLCKTMPSSAKVRAKGSIYVADNNMAATIYNIYETNSTDSSELTG
jgi:two-component system chemotaxis response regulator CheB